MRLKPDKKTRASTLAITVLLVLGFFQAYVPKASAQAGTTLLLPFIEDTTLVPGGPSFGITIVVSNVTKLWGFQLVFWYDTSVLTATDFGSFPPFILKLPGIINDEEGYVTMAFTSNWDDKEGLTTDFGLIAWIDFVADAYGTSLLHLSDTGLIDVDGIPIAHDVLDGFFANVPLHDVAITDVTVSPAVVTPGESVTIDVTIASQGLFNETEPFNVTVSYDSNPIETQTVTFLAGGANTTLTFTWDTTGVPVGTYVINATASVVPGETDTSDNTRIGTVTLTLEPIISVTPTSGSIGTKVQVTGRRFGANQHVVLSFDDTPIAEVFANNQGNLTAFFNIPLSESGTHFIKAWFDSRSVNATFTVIDESPLEINVEVGQIHFRGELAEFYIQTVFKGATLTATSVSATLHKPDGTLETLTVQQIATGLYKAPYNIPSNAPAGTYLLVVEANYLTDTIDSKGTSIESFLLSSTFTGWNALLISIDGDVGTIRTDVDLINQKLDAIKDIQLVRIENKIATLNSTVGLIKADIDTVLKPKIISIEGTTVKINSTVGVIRTDIDTIVEPKLISVEGTVAKINSAVGLISGNITLIKGDVASIKTDVGTIKTTLQGWTGTVSSIVTPAGTFNLLALTTSTLQSLTFSDNTITIVVSGPEGTTGTTNVVIPKQLLDGIESTIEEVAVTVNDQEVVFTYNENPEAYVLSISYTHSTDTIKIFLAGIPSPPLPLANIVMIIFIIAAATVGAALYFRIRKKTINP